MGKHIVLTRKAAMTLGALHGFLKPRLAQDAQINLPPILATLTSKNFTAQKPTIVKAVTKAVKGKLAQDASVEGLATLLDALEGHEAEDDPLPLETEANAGLPANAGEDEGGPDSGIHEQIKAFLQDKISPEDMAQIDQLIASESADAEPEDLPAAKPGTAAAAKEGEDEDLDDDEAEDKKAKDEPPPFKGKPEVGGGMSEDAVNKRVEAAMVAERSRAKAAREAERFVRPWVGDLAMAHDSAEEVYKTALTALGVDVKGVHPSAFKPLLQQVPLPSKATVKQDGMAQDAATLDSFAKRYPQVVRIKHA